MKKAEPLAAKQVNSAFEKFFQALSSKTQSEDYLSSLSARQIIHSSAWEGLWKYTELESLSVVVCLLKVVVVCKI